MKKKKRLMGDYQSDALTCAKEASIRFTSVVTR
jgi:hypothetical protein